MNLSLIYQNSEFWALVIGVSWLVAANLWPSVIPVTLTTEAGPLSPSFLLGYAFLRIVGKTATPGQMPLQPSNKENS